MALRSQRGWKYVDRSAPEPSGTKLRAEWTEANDQIVGALSTIVEASLQRELETIKSAKAAWEKLKEKTHPKGIIAKLENLQSAIRNRFTASTPFSTTITEIRDALTAVFENATPT
jgi:hypothetical protein